MEKKEYIVIDQYINSLLDEIEYIENNYTDRIVCNICSKEKDVQYFYKSRRIRNKCCKICISEYDKKKRTGINKEKYFISHILYSCKDSSNKRLAKGRKLCGEFQITDKDLYVLKEKQRNKCPYTNVELIWEQNSGWKKMSIDRIDNNVGYIPSNIQLVCWGINQAKSDFSHTDFEEFLSAITIFRNIKSG